MSRFERIFAVACACCKADGADVPEVEAVIRLLLPRLEEAFDGILTDIVDRAVDLLTADPGLTPEELALLLAAYVTQATRQGASPLSEATLSIVEQAALALASAARHLPDAAEVSLAAQHLQLLLEGLLERAVRDSVPTATGIAVAGLGRFAPQEARVAARASLAAALDVEGALGPLLDSWAYQTFNGSAVRAAADLGDNFIQIDAVRDNKTTTFCRLADGRVIPMALALAQLRRISEAIIAGDHAALLRAAPFHPDPENATQAEVDAVIAAGGLAPFHHGCRSRNRPVRI